MLNNVIILSFNLLLAQNPLSKIQIQQRHSSAIQDIPKHAPNSTAASTKYEYVIYDSYLGYDDLTNNISYFNTFTNLLIRRNLQLFIFNKNTPLSMT